MGNENPGAVGSQVERGVSRLLDEAQECSACHGKGWNDEWKAVRGHYMGGEVFRVQCDACEGDGK